MRARCRRHRRVDGGRLGSSSNARRIKSSGPSTGTRSAAGLRSNAGGLSAPGRLAVGAQVHGAAVAPILHHGGLSLSPRIKASTSRRASSGRISRAPSFAAAAIITTIGSLKCSSVNSTAPLSALAAPCVRRVDHASFNRSATSRAASGVGIRSGGHSAPSRASHQHQRATALIYLDPPFNSNRTRIFHAALPRVARIAPPFATARAGVLGTPGTTAPTPYSAPQQPARGVAASGRVRGGQSQGRSGRQGGRQSRE